MIAEAILCLALNVYHEARGEGPEGMTAVGTVTLNRVAHPDWPDTVCEVVRQRSQFSWTRGNPPVTEPDAWRMAKIIATDLLLGEADEVLDHRALWYHTTAVSPGWAARLEPLGRIGVHVFYAHRPGRAPRPLAAVRPQPRPEA